MSRGTATALGDIVRAAVRGADASLSDRELLGRFAEGEDQAAFASLFRRHSGMVLGVCRRALSNVQDAEDACQATFLLLARRAKSGRWQPSVANWLYTAARRVAGNARRATERRNRREKKAAVQDVVQPVDRMTGRELLDALDVELDRLPPAYREPLVLCYLEGLTRDEAAARLGLPPLTVKTRLERGRKRLGDALARHGCVAGAGLLALAATSPAGATPLRLLRGALAAAAGTPSPSVVELTRGVNLNSWGKAKLLLALAATCLLVVGGAGGRPISQGAPANEVPPPPPAVAMASQAKGGASREAEIVVTGKVVGFDGNPVPGAKLSLLAKDGPGKELGVSGADGRFSVSFPKGASAGYLVARAEGFGFDFREVDRLKDAGARDVEFRLVKDHAIRGRVLDTQGKPVPGVRVRVKAIRVYADDSLDSFLQVWGKRQPHDGLPGAVRYYGSETGQLPPATSDAEGRFTFRGLGRERLVVLSVDGPGIADAEYWVVNREGFNPGPYNEGSRKNIPKGLEEFSLVWLLYGPDLSAIAEAEKPIRGAVTAADTGKGKPGVVVRLTRGYNGKILLPFPLLATTDVNGRYEIRGARKMDYYMVEVAGDVKDGYMPAQTMAVDTVGYDPVVANLRVVKGVIVTGRVLDRTTGKGVPGRVMAAVLHDNPYAKDYPTFDSGSTLPLLTTAGDGSFRVVAIPGPVLLMGGPDGGRHPGGWEVVHRFKQAVPDPDYPQYFPRTPFDGAYLGYGGAISVVQGNWCKVLHIKPGTAEVRQDVLLEPATALPLLLRDEAGKPLSGVSAAGVSPKDWYPPVRCKTDTCTVYDAAPGKRRLVVLFEPARKLAATLEVKGDEKPPVTVSLRAPGTVKGRLIGTDGEPLAGVSVALHYQNRAAEEIHNVAYADREVVTGLDGSFAADLVLPGVPFKLAFKRQRKEFRLTDNPGDWLAIDSGRTKDLGSLTAESSEKKDE
jgi:RNA polymerase sigma factor (sigma-70 family)